MTLKRTHPSLTVLLVVTFAAFLFCRITSPDITVADDATTANDSIKPFPRQAAEASANALADEYGFDFRDANYDRDHLIPIGDLSLYSWSLFRPERRGLKVAIPWHQGEQKSSLGIAPTYTLHGDFEITAKYELLAADTPKEGGPVGGQIYVMAQETGNGASLLRGVLPEGRQVYFLFSAIRDESGRQRRAKTVATETRRGKLRFVRKGKTLHYLAAEEENDEFRELHKITFGDEPIGLFSAQSITNGSPSNVETLWEGISIRAERLEPVRIPIYAAPKLTAGDTSQKTALKTND